MDKSDFAIYQKGGDVLSMGFKFENLLKDKGLPAMIGGGKDKFHKNQYGIPVGLALLNKQLDKDKGTYHRNFEGGVVREELYRKLLHIGEQRKSSKSKTRKNKRKKKRKTRKLK